MTHLVISSRKKDFQRSSLLPIDYLDGMSMFLMNLNYSKM